MGLRKILTDKDPALHKVCRKVENFDSRLFKLLDDMRDTLIESGGVGLAALPVGVLRRVVLVINDEDEIMELINPEIIEASGSVSGVEGCLSVPGKYGVVTRPMKVTVKAQDRNGNHIDIRKVKPKVNDDCCGCGICAEVCPMGSIDPANTREYLGICIKCCACVKKCPSQARYYDDPGYIYHKEELEELYERRAEPEYFV